ncbi:MAG TPA: DUF4043 domain-containing protein [Acetobacteraceae bacterium]|nr:DUF4043 domain-containing protein [Acetobacteraceae bacterium]
MAGQFTSFPAALQAELQTGFLEREFEEGLDSVLAYRRESLMETVPARIGETLTRTRTGRKAPNTNTINPSTNTGLDNGMTPSDATLEQYQLSLFQYGDSSDVDLMGDLATIANNLTRIARNNGVQAAQSMERLARKALFSAYMGGNSRVRTDLGASTTTSCHVDDIRGFQQVLVNGVPTPVSGVATLTVFETAIGAGGVGQTLTVTGAAADGTDNSSVPDGISGVLTFQAATAPVNGDALIAINAPKMLRPYSKSTTAQLTGSDILTMGILLDGVSYLRDNAVPTMPDGTYHVALDNTSLRQLYADQDFKVLFAGRSQSGEYRDADIADLLGVKFIPTTETYVQQAGSSGATGVSANNVRVRRIIIMGSEHLIQGNFEGLSMWLERQGVNAFGEVFLVNNVAHIIRPPLDRLQQFASLSWTWIGCFAAPTDATATTTIIPTASNSLYKRSLVIETAG